MNRIYTADEISDACLIWYISFRDKRYYRYFRKYINNHSSFNIITRNFNNKEFQYSRFYFNNLALNFSESILLEVYLRRYIYFHSYTPLKLDDSISDSMSILKYYNNIEIDSVLFHKIFNIIKQTLNSYDVSSSSSSSSTITVLNTTAEILDILLFNFIKKDINKYYYYYCRFSKITSITSSRNYFSYYSTHYKHHLMYSIFDIMSIALKWYDSDVKIKKMFNDKFKRILFLLLQHNKNNDFDIFFYAMKYIVKNSIIYLWNFDSLNNVLKLLNLLKSFELPMDRISGGEFCFTFRINNSDDDDDDDDDDIIIRVSTPFELALLFVAYYEKRILGNEWLIAIIYNLYPASYRHNDFIHFFINNDAAYLDTRCAAYFFDNFDCLKCFLPLVNSKRRENKTNLKFIAARAIKKYNIDYSILKGISRFLYNFVTIV